MGFFERMQTAVRQAWLYWLKYGLYVVLNAELIVLWIVLRRIRAFGTVADRPSAFMMETCQEQLLKTACEAWKRHGPHFTLAVGLPQDLRVSPKPLLDGPVNVQTIRAKNALK